MRSGLRPLSNRSVWSWKSQVMSLWWCMGGRVEACELGERSLLYMMYQEDGGYIQGGCCLVVLAQ